MLIKDNAEKKSQSSELPVELIDTKITSLISYELGHPTDRELRIDVDIGKWCTNVASIHVKFVAKLTRT